MPGGVARRPGGRATDGRARPGPRADAPDLGRPRPRGAGGVGPGPRRPSGHVMHILTLTSLFPNACQPHHAVFVRTRMEHFTGKYGHRWTVVAPVPFFPRLVRVRMCMTWP